MGNGPSLKEIMDTPKWVDILKSHHTFGLNAAYRMYEKYNFWPTYFGCFDFLVNISHKESFKDLVLHNNPITEFYFIAWRKMKKELQNKGVVYNDRFVNFNYIDIPLDEYPHISIDLENFYNAGSSGANALQVGIMKGYKKIILLGCDCNYVEKVDGAEVCEGGNLMLTKDLKDNPNYWFNEYQKKGDTFNSPQTAAFQIPSWRNISLHTPDDVEIYNCSLASAIPYFKKESFEHLVSINYI